VGHSFMSFDQGTLGSVIQLRLENLATPGKRAEGDRPVASLGGQPTLDSAS